MRKYHITDLAANIPYIELYDSSLDTPPGISSEKIKETWIKYSQVVSEKTGTIFERVEGELAKMAASERFAENFVIVPMNMLLWLYAKGRGAKLPVQVYRK